MPTETRRRPRSVIKGRNYEGISTKKGDSIHQVSLRKGLCRRTIPTGPSSRFCVGLTTRTSENPDLFTRGRVRDQDGEVRECMFSTHRRYESFGKNLGPCVLYNRSIVTEIMKLHIYRKVFFHTCVDSLTDFVLITIKVYGRSHVSLS